jgi:CheY-like chemotaxis protein
MMSAHLERVLLVEDSAGDARLALEAFRHAGFTGEFNVARDGIEAIDYLRHDGRFQSASRPDLIILDLNMPRMDGREALMEIRSDPELTGIPVVIFTTSSAERDIAMSYEHQANCFLTKPVDLDEYFEAVQRIERFWKNVATLPRRSAVS